MVLNWALNVGERRFTAVQAAEAEQRNQWRHRHLRSGHHVINTCVVWSRLNVGVNTSRSRSTRSCCLWRRNDSGSLKSALWKSQPPSIRFLAERFHSLNFITAFYWQKYYRHRSGVLRVFFVLISELIILLWSKGEGSELIPGRFEKFLNKLQRYS